MLLQLVVGYDQGSRYGENSVDSATCGLQITGSNWKTDLGISLKARDDFMYDGWKIRTVEFYLKFTNINEDNKVYQNQKLGEITVSN